MSDCPQAATQGEDQISPSVSDEKMDTASESFPSSQHTPNTPSDLDDKVLGPNNPYPRDTPTSPSSHCQETLDNCYDPIGSYVGSDNAFVVNTGVLRLAHPAECMNDNDSYRNSDFYDVDNVTGDTVSPLCEDSSSIVSLKGSSEYSKSSEYTRHLDNSNNVKVESVEYQKSDNKSSGDVHRFDNTSVPLRLGNPRLTSTLTLTDDHPLMGLSSPESPPSAGNYPDLILPSRKSNRDDARNGARATDPVNFLNSDYSGVMSLSSTEDESFNKSLMNGDASSLYSEGFSQQDGPQRNTSKNNLYFTDNFTTDGNRSIDGSMSSDDPRNYSAIVDGKLSVAKSNVKMIVQPDILDSRKRNTNIFSTGSENSDYQNIKYDVPSNTRPDVAGRKKVKADIKAPKIRGNLPKLNTEQLPHQVLGRMVVPRSNINSRMEPNKVDVEKKVENLSYPLSLEFSNVSLHDYVSEVTEFPSSPSELRTSLNYELPIEPASSFPASDDVSSDSSSSSHDENERSLYCTEVDPFGGKVSLKPRAAGPPPNLPTRRRIKPLISEADTDSVTALNAAWLPGQRRSWSGSGSSVDSLCGYSIRSEEGDVIQGDGEIVPDCNTTNTAWSEDRSQEGEEEGEDEEDEDGTPEKIPEYSLNEERTESRRWLKVTLPAGEKRSIDMKVIEPYKRVLSHGGYALSGRRDAIVVFSACFLPDSSRVDYNYVMDNLFLYVLTTMEQLVTDDYILIYLHGSASKRSMPTFHWLKKCYQLIDRRLRKSLKHLYLVHPTFWLKSIMWMTRPFISSKFSRKLTYIHSLEELSALVPVEPASIPERVRQFEAART